MESCKYCSTDENSIDYHEIIECITCALDAKDPYTAGHSQRVSDMTLRVCQIMGFKDHDVERIHIAAHLNELKDIVLCHHERYDGKGYPNGREGCDIPIGARIIAICDSIDAITSNRCYRRAHDFTYCYQEIRKNLGAMYDPIVGQYVLDHWEWVTKGQKNKTKKATD